MSDPSDRSIIGAIAAHTSWANTSDRTARTQPGRDGLTKRFEREVDPDGVLTPEERALRAESARKAWFLGLSRKAAEARRAKAAAIVAEREAKAALRAAERGRDV